MALVLSRFAYGDGIRDVHINIRIRPAFSETYSENVSSARKLRFEPATIEYHDRYERTCPKSKDLVRAIFKTIIAANDLTPFLREPFGVEIRLNCYARVGKSSAKMSGIIEISAADIRAQDTIDEIAFIISHELSHLLLAHDEALIGIYQGLAIGGLDLRKIEIEADAIAIALLANAGFDFTKSASALVNIARAKGECWGPAFYCLGMKEELSERIDNIRKKTRISSIPHTNPIISVALKEVIEELKR